VPETPRRIANLAEHRGLLTEIAQLRAKALLRELGDDGSDIRWRYVIGRVMRNASIAAFELEESVDGDIAKFAPFARELALAWQAIAKLEEGPARNVALLNAAITFEFAGYQANAALMARHLAGSGDRDDFTRTVSLFLQRRLLLTLESVRQVTLEPDTRGMSEADIARALSTGLSGRALSAAARYLLSGDDALLQTAQDEFTVAEQGFATYGLAMEANAVRALKHLLPVIAKRTTWRCLGDAAPGMPRWQRYLKLLARGVGGDVYRGRSISELWPSQIAAIEHGLLSTPTSKLIRMPTSAGKTRIAEMAIIHSLVTTPGSKCVYVAPYRALVAELERAFFPLMSDLGYQVSQITGTYETDEFEQDVVREADLIDVTPEKLDLILRSDANSLDAVALYVLDEVQVLDAGQRGAKFELLLARLLRASFRARFLVTTAVVPQETLQDLAVWLRASPADIVRDGWRPSLQRYAKFRWVGQTGIIEYAPGEVAELPRAFVRGVIRQRVFEYINPRTGRWKRQHFPDPAHRAQVAAELAFILSSLGSVLVFCVQPNFAESVAAALYDRINLARVVGEDVPQHFDSPRVLRSAVLAEEWLGLRPITAWLRSGIGVHYGSLPDLLRTSIETDVRERRLAVLIATNTLAQGVNLPFRTVIVHTSNRYQDDTHVRLSARDYWNIAGRAGRAGEETEGLVVHLSLGSRDEEDFAYYLSRRQEVEPVTSPLLSRCMSLMRERLSDEAVGSELDAEIMPLLMEEGQFVDEKDIATVFDHTLASVQARRLGIDLLPIQRAVVSHARRVRRQVSDMDLLAAFTATGLSSSSCIAVAEHVRANERLVQEIMLERDVALESIVSTLLPVVLALAECRPAREFGASYLDLLLRWLQGTDLSEIMSEFAVHAQSPEDLGRLIDDVFRYRLPWGLSAYLKIAVQLNRIPRNEVVDRVRFLPSMVKYGVPDSISCWAMSAGLPFRRVAMRIGAAYVNEITNISMRGFREWLASLSTDRLREEFGLRSPVLEDVVRTVAVAGVNTQLITYETIDAFLPIEISVQGVQYANRSVAAVAARRGDLLDVYRDYDNAADRNAVVVSLRGREIGYVPREVAQVLAPEMDVGREVVSVVTAVQPGPVPEIRARLGLQRRHLVIKGGQGDRGEPAS
jgi:replicative superfamily II helicase